MIKIADIMTGLSCVRPVFHSEADFKHALACHIHQAVPKCEVRLEYRPFPDEGMYLDLWLGGVGVALELKYLTHKLHYDRGAEAFRLKNQSAQDTRRYDYLRDVQRLEQVAARLPQARGGFAVLLTNDAVYWKPPGATATIDSKFRLHEGRTISGELAWSARAAPGTIEGRRESIVLEGSYELQWQKYSKVGAMRNAEFRWLSLEVPA